MFALLKMSFVQEVEWGTDVCMKSGRTGERFFEVFNEDVPEPITEVTIVNG